MPKSANDKSHLPLYQVYYDNMRRAIRLDPVHWESLNEIAELEKTTPGQIYKAIITQGPPKFKITTALRVFILLYFKEAATKQGHEAADHGKGEQTICSLAKKLVKQLNENYTVSANKTGTKK